MNMSQEAQFHRLLTKLPFSKEHQGYIMGAFREATAASVPTKTFPLTDNGENARLAMADHLEGMAEALRKGAIVKSGGLWGKDELSLDADVVLEMPQ